MGRGAQIGLLEERRDSWLEFPSFSGFYPALNIRAQHRNRVKGSSRMHFIGRINRKNRTTARRRRKTQTKLDRTISP